MTVELRICSWITGLDDDIQWNELFLLRMQDGAAEPQPHLHNLICTNYVNPYPYWHKIVKSLSGTEMSQKGNLAVQCVCTAANGSSPPDAVPL